MSLGRSTSPGTIVKHWRVFFHLQLFCFVSESTACAPVYAEPVDFIATGGVISWKSSNRRWLTIQTASQRE